MLDFHITAILNAGILIIWKHNICCALNHCLHLKPPRIIFEQW